MTKPCRCRTKEDALAHIEYLGHSHDDHSHDDHAHDDHTHDDNHHRFLGGGHGGVHLGNHKLHDTERVFVVMSMIILSIFIVENLLLLVASPTEFLTVETTCV